jgi:hypothetical protein
MCAADSEKPILDKSTTQQRSSPDDPARVRLEEDICAHIFTVSAGMVGVCLTVIGILRVVITAQRLDTLADDLLALDAVLFLFSCFLSYWALRTRGLRRMHRVERVADVIFLLALALMTVICCFICFAIAAGTLHLGAEYVV